MEVYELPGLVEGVRDEVEVQDEAGAEGKEDGDTEDGG